MWRVTYDEEPRFADSEQAALDIADQWAKELFETSGVVPQLRVSFLPPDPQWEPRYVVNVIGRRMAERGEW
jgi:hypothetical protein